MYKKLLFIFMIYFTVAVNAQWVQTNGPNIGTVNCFAISGTNIYAGTNGGVFLSTNNGTSWTAINTGLTNIHVNALAVSSTTTNGTNLFAGTDSGGVFLSTNNGTSWTAVNNGLANLFPTIWLTINGTNLFAVNNSSVYLSTNNGTNWRAVSSGLTSNSVISLAVNGTNLFAGTFGDGVYLSTNNGTSWTAVNSGLTNNIIISFAVNGTNLFAGTFGGGVFLSTNNGTSWTEVNNGFTSPIPPVHSFAVNGTNLFAGTNGSGVYLSTNNGSSWTAVNSGLPNNSVASLADNETNLFAGTLNNGIWMRPLSEMITGIQAANTNSATSITSTTAILNGTVNPNGTSTTVQFDYGTTTSYGTTITAAISPVTGSAVINDSVNITGLTPNTLYHFRVKATNGGGISYGADSTFTTLSLNTATMTIETIKAVKGDTILVPINVTNFNNIGAISLKISYNTSALTFMGIVNTIRQVSSDAMSGIISMGWFDATGTSPTNISNGKLFDLKFVFSGISSSVTFDTSQCEISNESGNDIPVKYINGAVNSTTQTIAITNSATNITQTAASLNGTINPSGLSTTVQFEYGTTSSYGNTIAAAQSPVGGNNYVNVSANIAGLTLNTLYHLRVKATNSGGTNYGADSTFITLPNPPVVTTNSATSITQTSVTLNGVVNPNGVSTTVQFDYGTTTSYGTTVTAAQSPITGNSNVNVSANIAGLTLNTLYHFRVKATNSGGTNYGADSTFTTLPNPPVVTTNSATSITQTSVTLNGAVNPNGVSTTVQFDYGATTSYGNTITAAISPVTGSAVVNDSVNITGLTPNTLYHFRVKATNNGGTTFGSDSTFTTLPNVISTKVSVNLPTLTRQQSSAPEWINVTTGDLTGQNVSAFQFTLSYNKSVIFIDSAITGPVAAGGSFVFNADTNNQQIKVAFASSSALSGSGTLVQLKVHYVNSGTSPLVFNSTFEFNEGTPVAIVTEGSITVVGNGQLPTVTTLSTTTIGSTSSTLNGIANANGSSTTVQFDYGTTTSYGTTVTASQSPVTGSSNVSVSANIISLTPNTLYHYRVKATNSVGTTYGADSTFTTLSSSQFWVQTNGPYPYVEILTLAINSSGYIFAGTNGSGAYLSTDNGTSWAQLYKGLSNSHVRSLAINSAGYVFAGTDGGVNLSTNNGTNWSQINNGLETDTLVQTIAINSSGYIFAGTSTGGVFLSTNSGTSWSPVNNGLTTGNVHTLAINSSAYIFAGMVGGGVFISTNNGSSWSPVNIGITNTSILTLTVNSSGNVFAGTYGGGVFLSTNNGTSWTAQNNGLPNGSYIYSLAINSAGYLFAGMGNLNLGVYASTNNGTNWAIAGLQDNNVSALAVNSSGYVFAGTYEAGVYRTSNPTVYIAIPTAPVLSSPANGSTGISINPALYWNTSSGAASYRLQVSADSTFATTIYDTSGVTFTSKIVIGLSYQVKYFWRVNATDPAGTSGWSNVWNFTTISNINLVLVTNTATNITQTSAYLNGTVNPNGISSTTVQFDYGTSISYGTTVYASPNPVSGNSNINVYANINGLTANTLYHFRVKATNSNGTSYGADSTFTTLNVNVQPPPSVTTLSATSIGSTSATLNGIVNANGASSAVQFDYGTSTSYGATITASLATGNTPVNDSTQIGNLTPYTLYHYRVKATNSGGTSYGFDMTFTTTFIYPTSISISQSYTFSDPTQPSSYKLIGLPGNLNSLLTQVLPGTPKQDWDAYYDNGATSNYLIEFNNSSTFQFKPGNGFWIISKNGISISQSVNTVTLSSDNSFSISLNNGWNIISNPFDKSVVWDSVISANSLDTNLIIYGWNAGWSTPGSFDPYKGYYFYNQHNLPSLKIPYNPNGTIGKSISKAAVFNENDGAGSLRMSLNIGNEEKSFIIISIDSTSSNDYDKHDLLAPPGDFEDAGIILYNEKLSISYKNLLKESRPMMGNGQAFDINITDKQKKQVILKLEGVNSFKVSEVYLLDIYNSKLYNLKENNSIVLNPNQESKYQILIGNTDFIKTAEKEILPAEYKLYQNYPNPFNPSTTINYSVPKTSFVSIKVYNILGNEVVTLVNEEKQAGNYSVQLAAGNRQLASGVYFYRMQTGGFVATKKLVLLK